MTTLLLKVLEADQRMLKAQVFGGIRMEIDTTFVASVLPLIQQLVTEHQAPQWDKVRELPGMEGLLENGRVVEAKNRSLFFGEWTSLWESAVRGQTNEQMGVRQRFMHDNMRTSV